MPEPLTLPDGLDARPLSYSDAAAVFQVMAASELADVGEVVIEEADIVSDWQRPSFDVSASTVGVFEAGTLIGYAEVSGAGRGDAAVHPDHRGRGIGTQLAYWMQQRAREAGAAVIGMPVPQGSPGDVLLETLGYRVRWESWVLRLPEGAAVPTRPLPDGYLVREAEQDEYPACWTVTEDAFLEWSVRDREPYEDWAAGVSERPGFESWNLRVVIAPSGEVVGVALVLMAPGCAYIAKLATSKDQRGRGLAQALLVDAFAVAAAHGAVRSELSTDSRTGALGLYEKVGMVVASTWVNRAKDL
jgi:mycothiol synthase